MSGPDNMPWPPDVIQQYRIDLICAGETIWLAPVLHDAETGLYDMYTGLPVSTA
jgi:hypothetical protein